MALSSRHTLHSQQAKHFIEKQASLSLPPCYLRVAITAYFYTNSPVPNNLKTPLPHRTQCPFLPRSRSPQGTQSSLTEMVPRRHQLNVGYPYDQLSSKLSSFFFDITRSLRCSSTLQFLLRPLISNVVDLRCLFPDLYSLDIDPDLLDEALGN